MSPKTLKNRWVKELLKESGLRLWVPIMQKTQETQEIGPRAYEIKDLESALVLPRVKFLFIFPEDLLSYWEKTQGLFLNISHALGLRKGEYAVLFGAEKIFLEDLSLLKNLCRRTSARKIVSFGISFSVEKVARKPGVIEIISTKNLNEVWENPLQKKQVWNDVSRILL